MGTKKEAKKKGILVGYARASTYDQDANMQIDALTEAGVDERHLFQEKISGKDSSRTKLKEALNFLKKGDVFVVWRLDRLGRSLQDLIRIVGDLKKNGVGFKSLTEGIDTTYPGGILVFHIFGALAQFERELIQERTLAGLEAARKRGRRGGRPRSISDEQKELMHRLLNEGAGVSAVARALGVSRYTIYREKASSLMKSLPASELKKPARNQIQDEKENAKLSKMPGKALQANDPNQLGFF